MAAHILWQNTERTITLIDVPRSIVDAQGFNSPADHHLLSSEARETPYPSSEPKTAKGKAKLVHNTVDETLHAIYRGLLTHALQEVKKHHQGSWCLPRPFAEDTRLPTKKRKLEPSASGEAEPTREVQGAMHCHQLPGYYLSSLARAPLEQTGQDQAKALDRTNDESQRRAEAPANAHYLSNDSDGETTLSTPAVDEAAADAIVFRIPPRSAFCLGDCAASHDFRKALREHARQEGITPLFDFILLDPPWPNRSIKRTHKTAGASYQTMPSLDGLEELVLDMQLENLMQEDALVGIWISNKQAVRDLVLGEGGFFECWGLDLVEEWLWLKTTTSGEPTSVLDATWKKPYETLLFGRRGKRTDAEHHAVIKRRVVIGVPDLHSRKPCLKSLIESLVPNRTNYNALEIFARHLVAGWCSWGDECIKFNYNGYWHPTTTSPSPDTAWRFL